MRTPAAQRNYMNNMMSHFTLDYEKRRRAPSGIATPAGSPLKVDDVHLYINENAMDHHTEMFELVTDEETPTPILRRGLPFYIAVRFDRDYNPESDIVKLQLDFGPSPAVTKGTQAIMTMLADAQPQTMQWQLLMDRNDGNMLTLKVNIPPSVPVGIWRCTVLTSLREFPQVTSQHKVDYDIYILFNPWCKDDGVYMSSEEERNEYILNESGKVWMGSFKQPKGRRWIFGQFNDVVLPTTMYLLELSDLTPSDRGNPVLVTRAISAVINSAEDDGLIEGKWDGDYKDGTNPHAWTGSVAIMEQYLQRQGEPVKYGQCWVFSGLVVTVCRALGIPCRSVTNYVSAHDTNSTLTVDKFFNMKGEEIVGGPTGDCHDSCWNFHVWNDVWMSRPDLPQGYGGWQIIDATPQETSGNIHRCGPASVEAVRNGKVGFNHDTPFVFSEVNADVCHFREDGSSDWGFSKLKINQYHVGRRIITKRIDRDDDRSDSDMWDVTTFYKNPEGSREERLSVFNAIRGVGTAQAYYDFPEPHEEDVFFDLIEVDKIPFGEPFQVVVNIENKSREPRHIEAVLSANSVHYTGVTVHQLRRAQGGFTMGPGQRETLRIVVHPKDYLEKLVDHSLVKINAIATVKETRQTWSEEDDFPLIKPSLDIQISGALIVNHPCRATFHFKNPLNQILTGCYINVEGPGLQRPKMVQLRNINPNEVVTYVESFHPRRSGERKIVGNFSSVQLSDVSGSTTVNIQEN